MSRQASLWDLRESTCSAELPGGITPSTLPDGKEKSGRAPALANLSARQAGERGLLTSGTYGRTGFTSSGSASLQRSLESRLRARLPLSGLILFRMTWKVRVTPLGRLICALRASGRSTSGKDCGSWGTPRVTTNAGHPSPQCTGKGSRLEDQAALASWPTPQVFDAVVPENISEEARERQLRRGDPNGIPRTTTGSLANKSPEAHLAMKKRMGERDGTGANRTAITDLQVMAKTSGTLANGCPAGTGSGGQLNPAFSRWLMGYPAEWDDCAPTGTASSRKSGRSSSGQFFNPPP
jgi:hypothetical protein